MVSCERFEKPNYNYRGLKKKVVHGLDLERAWTTAGQEQEGRKDKLEEDQEREDEQVSI